MDLEGAIVGLTMMAPPAASYFVLRRGGRRFLGALLGAGLVLALSLGLAVALVGMADRYGMPLDTAMWLYPAAVIAIAIAIWRATGTR